MLQEPTLLDFKTERDVNYAIANAFIYAMNISKCKFLLDALHWSAEQEVNSDLFDKSAPWYKGYEQSESEPIRYTPIDEPASDKPSQDEMNYTKRDKSLVEYVPKHIMDPWNEGTLNLSYKLIDNRVALLALSWWTLFISTKDGQRMVYYPYTSQLKDAQNLKTYPSRNVWFKDTLMSEYYRNLGVNTQNLPEIVGEEGALDFSYTDLESFLKLEGLKFVLWLYNYVKKNNGLVPYIYSDEYLNSLNDTPVYRNGGIIDINLNTPLGKFSNTDQNRQIDGATGISQTSFNRDANSCGILLNTPENIQDLTFTNENLKIRINRKFKKILREQTQESITSKPTDRVQYSNRIVLEAQEVASTFTGFNGRVTVNYVSSENVDRMTTYGLTSPLIQRPTNVVDEKNIRK